MSRPSRWGFQFVIS